MIFAKNKIVAITTAVVITACTIPTKPVLGQFSESKQEAANQNTSVTKTIRTTLDRTDVPLITETKEIAVNKKTTLQDSVTKIRRADGTYDDWIRSSHVEKKHSDHQIERSTHIFEKNRQGKEAPIKIIKETITKSSAGELTKTGHYEKNHSGDLVLKKETSAVSSKRSDGSISTVRTEMKADVNGRLKPNKEIYEVSTQISPSEQFISRTVKSIDRMNGRFGITAKETISVETKGNDKLTETTIQQPGRDGWAVTDKIKQIERLRPDGTIERETIELGRSIYSRATGNASPLVPKVKTIEEQVRKPDGTLVMEKKVFKRDVNGEWKPVTFAIGSPSVD